jgi:hypothetical protein
VIVGIEVGVEVGVVVGTGVGFEPVTIVIDGLGE